MSNIHLYSFKEKITTAVPDAEIIMSWLKNIFQDEFSSVVRKIIGVVSDNAAAANLTRLTLLQKFNEEDPETAREAVKCSGFTVTL